MTLEHSPRKRNKFVSDWTRLCCVAGWHINIAIIMETSSSMSAGFAHISMPWRITTKIFCWLLLLFYLPVNSICIGFLCPSRSLVFFFGLFCSLFCVCVVGFLYGCVLLFQPPPQKKKQPTIKELNVILKVTLKLIWFLNNLSCFYMSHHFLPLSSLFHMSWKF